MSILVNHDTKLIVQGITGRNGSFHATKMKEYRTNVVGGTSSSRAGQEVAGIPVFNMVKNVVKAAGASTSVIFVSVTFAKGTTFEAADAGIQLIICIAKGVPTLDVVEAYRYISDKGTKLIDPNYPGSISPGESMVGIMPTDIFKKGHTGVISRSGILTYQMVTDLTVAGFRQPITVSVGGDPIMGLYFQDLSEMFQNDPETDNIILISEIGGDAEERAADHIKQYATKPVVTFISRRETLEGKQMGHAGAIVSSGSGMAAEKIATFEAVGVPVARETYETPTLLKERT